jgi:hypothetical protein
MGIPELRDLNLCLLASWIQRYYEAGDKLWRRIIDFKCSHEFANIFCCDNRNCSPFWKGVMWAAKAVKMGYRWRVSDEKKIRFWEDQ